MELNFRRNDIFQVGSTRPGTLCVLPLGKSKQQKVVVGDDTGVVQAFGIKKGEPVNKFKGLPGLQPVSAVTTGAGVGQGDKVYVATGTTIRGLTKKGKEFFRFDTNMAEAVKSLQVRDVTLWTASDFIYNQFQDCRDAHFYMAADAINDLALVDVTGGVEPNAVLACQDRLVRVLKGSDLYYEAAVDGAVQCIRPFRSTKRSVDGAPAEETKRFGANRGREVLYGTANGSIGQLFLEPDAARRGWVLPGGKRAGGVTSISCSVDYTKDGLDDVVVGRDDGSIEVYGFDQAGDVHLVYHKEIGESVSTLDGGFVMSAAAEDIVVESFSGKVLAFTTGGPVDAFGTTDTTAAAAAAVGDEKRIKALSAEIAKLRERLEREQERFARQSEEPTLVATAGDLRINQKFVLDPEDACYALTLETQMPIEMVALQSDLPLELLQVEGSTLTLSCTTPDPGSGSCCLATYRCQEPTSRVELRLRTIEGQYGLLQAFLIPGVRPKTSQVCTFRIRPLSLHQRVQSLDGDRPLNELKITGAFTLADAHAWVSLCLPEIPSRTPLHDVSTCYFLNTFVGTVLIAQYRSGEATFRSDNISTISIIKEAITREATARKLRISVTFELQDTSPRHFLQLVHLKLEYQLSLAQKVELVEALREIKIQEDDVSFLAPAFLEVLQNASRIETEFKLQPRRLELLQGVVKDFCLDWYRFKGRPAKQGLAELDIVLTDYTFDALVSLLEKGV